MIVFEGNTASEVWLKAFNTLTKSNISNKQKSRAGDTKELLHVAFTIKNPRERWISTRYPSINPAFAIAELTWIFSGRNDAKFINYWNRQLPQYAGYGKEYDGAYGYRIRKQFNIDQLKKVYETLLYNPDSRQAVIQIWDPRADLPLEKGEPKSKDIPCNICSLLKIRNNKLEWMQILRSNDIFRGLPYNFIQFTFLQEIIASWLKIELGSYNQISDSLHLYVNDTNTVSVTKRKVKYINTDNIDINIKDSEKYFKILNDKINILTEKEIKENKLLEISKWNDAPTFIRNYLFVLCAEIARKNKYDDVTIELINKCTNKLLKEMFINWCERLKSGA